MRMLVREGNKFRLYGRAVAWPCTLNLSIEKGRVCQSATQHLVYLLVCVAGPAGKLRKLPVRAEERELMVVCLSRLRFHLVKVNRPAVYAHRSACLHAFGADSVARDAFRKVMDSRLGASSAFYFPSADVHQSVEEGAGGDDYRPRIQADTPYCPDTQYLAVLCQQFVSLVLKDVKMVRVVKSFPPFPDEFATVALCARTPYGRAFGPVQHTELYRRGIGYQSHIASKSIYLSDYLSFGNSSNGRVTAHLPDFIHVHCHQTSVCTHVGGCRSSLTTCVSTADNKYIILEFHRLLTKV